MLFTVGVVLGLVIGSVLLALARGGTTGGADGRRHPVRLPWLALVLGVSGAVVFAAGMAGPGVPGLMIAAIALPTAAFLLGVGRLASGDRAWQYRLGAALGLVPVSFWVVFVLGELLGPAH